LIQTVVPLADGSAVSVTVARYQTPSGADINKVGISPDAPLPVVTVGSGVEGRVTNGDADAKEKENEKEKGSALPSEPSAFCAVVANDEGVAKALFPR
jgi:C-terminal processing protease CtpA/Prc